MAKAVRRRRMEAERKAAQERSDRLAAGRTPGERGRDASSGSSSSRGVQQNSQAPVVSVSAAHSARSSAGRSLPRAPCPAPDGWPCPRPCLASSTGGAEEEDINAELGVGSVAGEAGAGRGAGGGEAPGCKGRARQATPHRCDPASPRTCTQRAYSLRPCTPLLPRAAADAELDAMKEQAEAQILGGRGLLGPYARLVSAGAQAGGRAGGARSMMRPGHPAAAAGAPQTHAPRRPSPPPPQKNLSSLPQRRAAGRRLAAACLCAAGAGQADGGGPRRVRA